MGLGRRGCKYASVSDHARVSRSTRAERPLEDFDLEPQPQPYLVM